MFSARYFAVRGSRMNYIEYLENSNSEMIEELAKQVRIDSVKSEPVRTPEGELYPFGKGVQESLTELLKLGESMGFEVYTYDNYGG